jgi:hypothetical protein
MIVSLQGRCLEASTVNVGKKWLILTMSSSCVRPS